MKKLQFILILSIMLAACKSTSLDNSDNSKPEKISYNDMVKNHLISFVKQDYQAMNENYSTEVFLLPKHQVFLTHFQDSKVKGKFVDREFLIGFHKEWFESKKQEISTENLKSFQDTMNCKPLEGEMSHHYISELEKLSQPLKANEKVIICSTKNNDMVSIFQVLNGKITAEHI